MPTRPFGLTPRRLLQPTDLERAEEGACRLLEQVGIKVDHPAFLERLARGGIRPDASGRVRLSRERIRAYLEQARGGRTGAKVRVRPASVEIIPAGETPSQGKSRLVSSDPSAAPAPVRFRIGTTGYPLSVLDPKTNETVPFTTKRLVEATRLAAALESRGLMAGVPGYPADVAPPLQPLMKMIIGVENIARFDGFIDAKTHEPLPYLLEMTEVLGRPLRSLPFFVFSPLRLTGEWVEAAMQFESRLDGLHVTSMPGAGTSAPIRPLEALAMATAEVVGSALLLQEGLKNLEVSWGMGLFGIDLRGLQMSFGSPENYLLGLAAEEMNAHLHASPLRRFLGDIHALAQMPGPQAAAEKAIRMTTEAYYGARVFLGAGALSLDEVFSPIQLMIDLEIKDHVERLVNGLDATLELDSLCGRVTAGLDEGFAGAVETLLEHRRLYWHPRLFEHRSLASWQAAGCPDLCAAARRLAEEAMANYRFEPPADKVRALREIYARAERELR